MVSCFLCSNLILSEKYTLSCGHFFHIRCIRSWVSKNKTTCPHCGDKISRNDKSYTFDDMYCSLCKNSTREKQSFRVLECNHCFHINCLRPMRKDFNQCPTCAIPVLNTLLQERLLEEDQYCTLCSVKFRDRDKDNIYVLEDCGHFFHKTCIYHNIDNFKCLKCNTFICSKKDKTWFKDVKSNAQCGVCKKEILNYLNYLDNPYCYLECGHGFHLACAKKLLDFKLFNCCPVSGHPLSRSSKNRIKCIVQHYYKVEICYVCFEDLRVAYKVWGCNHGAHFECIGAEKCPECQCQRERENMKVCCDCFYNLKNCGHRFHPKCLQGSVYRFNCPTCKKLIAPEDFKETTPVECIQNDLERFLLECGHGCHLECLHDTLLEGQDYACPSCHRILSSNDFQKIFPDSFFKFEGDGFKVKIADEKILHLTVLQLECLRLESDVPIWIRLKNLNEKRIRNILEKYIDVWY